MLRDAETLLDIDRAASLILQFRQDVSEERFY